MATPRKYSIQAQKGLKPTPQQKKKIYGTRTKKCTFRSEIISLHETPQIFGIIWSLNGVQFCCTIQRSPIFGNSRQKQSETQSETFVKYMGRAHALVLIQICSDTLF